MEESADVEVYRITKYDKDWNRISSAGLYDCNTTLEIALDESGNKVVVLPEIIFSYAPAMKCISHQTAETIRLT